MAAVPGADHPSRRFGWSIGGRKVLWANWTGWGSGSVVTPLSRSAGLSGVSGRASSAAKSVQNSSRPPAVGQRTSISSLGRDACPGCRVHRGGSLSLGGGLHTGGLVVPSKGTSGVVSARRRTRTRRSPSTPPSGSQWHPPGRFPRADRTSVGCPGRPATDGSGRRRRRPAPRCPR